MRLLVYDFGGLNTEVAVTLAHAGHHVAYYTPSVGPSPECVNKLIGQGLEGLTRIPPTASNDGFWQAADRADAVICPDTNSADIVYEARKRGLPTWGAGGAEILENDRVFCRETLKRLDLPVIPYTVITGVEPLMAHLKKHKDLWIKLPGDVRGNKETFKHDQWDSTAAQYWGQLLLDFGAYANELVFVVEKPMKDPVECAWDGAVVGGDRSFMMLGYEAKDEGYIGRLHLDRIPDGAMKILGKLEPFFKQHGTASCFSPESMVDKHGDWFLSDPCVRCGHPITAAQLVAVENYADIILAGTEESTTLGRSAAPYVAALVISSDWSTHHWTEIKIDPKVRHLVKLQRAYAKDGHYYALPGQAIVATAVGLGDTVDEAIDAAGDVASKVHCKDMDYNLNALVKLRDETIPEGEKRGIRF